MSYYPYEFYQSLAEEENRSQYLLKYWRTNAYFDLHDLIKRAQDAQNEYNYLSLTAQNYHEIYEQDLISANNLRLSKSINLQARSQHFFDRANQHKELYIDYSNRAKIAKYRLEQINLEIKSTHSQIDIYSALIKKSINEYSRLRRLGKKSQFI